VAIVLEPLPMGAVVSVVNIAIWLGIGGLWWKLLGLW